MRTPHALLLFLVNRQAARNINEHYLGVDDKYLPLWDANFPVTELISISISKARIKWIVIRWEELLNILKLFFRKMRLKICLYKLYLFQIEEGTKSFIISVYLQTCNLEFMRCSSYNCHRCMNKKQIINHTGFGV